MKSSLRIRRTFSYGFVALCAIGFSSSGHAGPGTVTYSYDEAGRLKAAQYATGEQRSYTLDPAGNRKQTAEGQNAVQFTVTATSVRENAGAVTVQVSRTGSIGATSVTCSAAILGTGIDFATASTDFSTAPVTLTWANGDASPKSCSIAIIDDATREGRWVMIPYEGLVIPVRTPERFAINLSSPSGAALGTPASVTVAIQDND